MNKNIKKLSELTFLMAEVQNLMDNYEVSKGMVTIAHMLEQFANSKGKDYSKALQLEDTIDLMIQTLENKKERLPKINQSDKKEIFNNLKLSNNFLYFEK